MNMLPGHFSRSRRTCRAHQSWAYSVASVVFALGRASSKARKLHPPADGFFIPSGSCGVPQSSFVVPLRWLTVIPVSGAAAPSHWLALSDPLTDCAGLFSNEERNAAGSLSVVDDQPAAEFAFFGVTILASHLHAMLVVPDEGLNRSVATAFGRASSAHRGTRLPFTTPECSPPRLYIKVNRRRVRWPVMIAA